MQMTYHVDSYFRKGFVEYWKVRNKFQIHIRSRVVLRFAFVSISDGMSSVVS